MPMYVLPTWMNKKIFQKKIYFFLFLLLTNFCDIIEFNKGWLLLEVCKKKKRAFKFSFLLKKEKICLFSILGKKEERLDFTK